MKKLRYIFLVLWLLSCNSENAGDCFQTTGNIVEQEIEVPPFSKILVNENVALIIRQGTEQEVVIQTGKNLLPDVSAKVENNKLILSDNNSCNYVRNYGTTKIYVTAPDITEIRSSSQLPVYSEGVLKFTSMDIYSEDYLSDYQSVGEFYLELDMTTVRFVFNNLSNAYVSGHVENLDINFSSGNSRFMGENLLAEHVTFYHRSSNDVIVNPVQSLVGDIYSTGDVRSKNHPGIVEVVEHYRGRLIFED